MLEGDDYWRACAWWIARKNWTPMHPLLLGNFGMMATIDGVPAAAGWLILTSSKWAWVDFIVTNPANPIKQTPKALKCLIERLRDEATGFGALRTYTCLKSKGLMRIYAELGFDKMDEGMTNMVFKNVICN